MTTLEELEAIQAAYKILDLRAGQHANGVTSIYTIVRNAEMHLSRRAKELLAEEVQ